MTSRLGAIIITVTMIWSVTTSVASDGLSPPTEYIQTKLKQNDIVFLGTEHRKPKILNFIAKLIPSLKGLGVNHIGLEIPSGQQYRIDTFMETGKGLDGIILYNQIDTSEYRHLLEALREFGGPSPMAIDLPYTRHGGSISRDKWMAQSLVGLLPGKILVIVGNLHIFKKLEWEEHVPNKNLSIRQYIQQQRPDTRMWSVGQEIDADAGECDFTQVFGHLPGSVALDLDNKVVGWKMGLTSSIAIVPAESFELVDGLIVY